MGNIGIGELILIVVIVLLVFGANRLPGVGKAFGRSIREFKNAVNSRDDEPRTNGEQN